MRRQNNYLQAVEERCKKFYTARCENEKEQNVERYFYVLVHNQFPMLCQLVPACSLPLSRGLSCTGGRNHTTTIIVIFRVIIISLLLGAPWNLIHVIHLLKAISCAIRSVWDSVQLCIWRIATAIKNATDQIVHNHTQLANDKHPFVNTLKHFENPLLSLHWKYLNQQLIMSSRCNMNVWTNNLLPI